MAIVTSKFKREMIQLLLNDFNDSASNKYYIGIGRSDDWNATDTAPAVENHDVEARLFRNSLQSVKKVSDISFVVPRRNWSSGAKYSAYNDKQVGYPTEFPYYVMNDNNQVYICVQQAKNAEGEALNSTIQPSGNTSGTTFITSDDYGWKFLYSISALDASKFMAANFIPVKKQFGSGTQASDAEQLAVQTAAVDGEIIGYALDSGGEGYTSAPTLTIVGDGTKAKAVAALTGTSISKVDVQDSASTLCLGSGYTNAIVTQSGGSPTKPAKIRPIFASKNGAGSDPRQDLRSSNIMLAVKPAGTESDDFVVGNDFRQVGLFRNILDSSAGTIFTSATGIALKQLVFSSGASGDDAFTPDKNIIGLSSGIKGIIDKVDGTNVWYHQNDQTGYGNFTHGEAVEETDGNGEGTLHGSSSLVLPEVESLTGDLLYIDNRGAVTRASDQTEDIKIVIQL